MANSKIRKSISIDTDLFKKSQIAAHNIDRNFSNLISMLLKEFLKNKK